MYYGLHVFKLLMACIYGNARRLKFSMSLFLIFKLVIVIKSKKRRGYLFKMLRMGYTYTAFNGLRFSS